MMKKISFAFELKKGIEILLYEGKIRIWAPSLNLTPKNKREGALESEGRSVNIMFENRTRC